MLLFTDTLNLSHCLTKKHRMAQKRNMLYRKPVLRTLCKKQFLAESSGQLRTYMPDPPAGEKSHGIFTDLMVLWWGMPISSFLKKSFFFYNFWYIWFILGRCGRKQADFVGGYDRSSLTRFRINTFSSVILLIETFSKWNSRLHANTN